MLNIFKIKETLNNGQSIEGFDEKTGYNFSVAYFGEGVETGETKYIQGSWVRFGNRRSYDITGAGLYDLEYNELTRKEKKFVDHLVKTYDNQETIDRIVAEY